MTALFSYLENLLSKLGLRFWLGCPVIFGVAGCLHALTGSPGSAVLSPGLALSCDVTQFGAKGDGATLNTHSIQLAVDTCAAAGGGAVILPVDPAGGVYVSGMITLKSNITFTIATGVVLKGSKNDDDYPKVVPDPKNTQVTTNCQKALLYSNGAHNVVIEGGGKVDGSGENPNWLNLNSASADYSEPSRPMAIYLTRSTAVVIQNITVLNAAMWAVVILENNGVHIDNITVDSNYPNSITRDGIDIVDSQNVLIENSTVTSEDDAICMKSGLTAAEPMAGVKNVTVQNCAILKSQVANGLKIGTASTGPFQNIVFDTVTVQRVKQAAMAITSVDGGSVSGVTFKNIEIANTGALTYVILGARGTSVGAVDNVNFQNITASNLTQTWGSTITGSVINGVTHSPSNIYFENVNVTAEGGLISVPSAPPEYPYDTGQYPDPQVWGNLPAFGYYLRHVKNVQFSLSSVVASPTDARPAFESSDVTGTGF